MPQTASSAVLLVINSGSSSLKFAVYPVNSHLHVLFQGQITGIGGKAQSQIEDAHGQIIDTQSDNVQNHQQAITYCLHWLKMQTPTMEIIAAAHRVVHGGQKFQQPVVISHEVMDYLHSLIPLAPNHQLASLAGIKVLQQAYPQMIQIACFDTSFHYSRAEVEQHFALPDRPELEQVRRYGFHGLSYEYIASVLPDYTPQADGRVIVAHLGHGASLCAMWQRRSQATTMTFTPLDGIPMGSRSGSIDPAVVLYLQSQGMSADEVSDLLYFHSGLLGVSGQSGDMAELLADKSPPAERAIEQFVHYTVRAIGSLAAALQGLDVLVFSGGIGEHSSPIRAAICQRCQWLGLKLDEAANQRNQSQISTIDSPLQAYIIPTDEAHIIARHSLYLLGAEQHRTLK